MTTRRDHRRTLTVSVSLTLAFALAGCGVRATGDAAAPAARPGSSTTAPLPSDTPAAEQPSDAAEDLYTDLGMDPDKAGCLAQAMPDDAGSLDMPAMLDLLARCELTAEDMNAFAERVGGDTPAEMTRRVIAMALERLGLDEEQSACVSAEFLDAFGSDIAALQDQNLRKMFAACGVDPDELRPPG